MKKIFCLKNIKWFVLLFLATAYTVAFGYRYHHEVKPDIRYYDMGTKQENKGMEYRLSAKIYDSDAFMDEFHLEPYEVPNIHFGYDVTMIVVEEDITRVNQDYEVEKEDDLRLRIYNKYWISSLDVDLTDLIQKPEAVPLEELKVGESTSRYQVFTIASVNHCKRIWESVREAEVWFEFEDSDQYPYVRRVKILN